MSLKKNDTRPFHFKQFSLSHHNSTMKTGTDAILLGVWTDVSNIINVLDIGSGSGIISLFIAARSNANITAVESDSASVIESSVNFASSDFADRLQVVHTNFNEYKTEVKFDLIVSNPPFFTHDLHSPSKRKTNARHTESLSFEQLCSGASKFMNDSARFCVVLPYTQSEVFKEVAQKSGLYPSKELFIFPRRGAEPNRINIEFKKQRTHSCKKDFFVLREENNKFTDQYKELLGNYYLSIPEQ